MPPREEPAKMVFWRNPVTALSIAFLAVVVMSGVLMLSLPMTEPTPPSWGTVYSLTGGMPSDAGGVRRSEVRSPDINALLYWIERTADAGNLATAVDELKNILVLDPANREALLMLGRLYGEQKRRLEAIDAYRRLYRTYPEPANGFFLAQSLRAGGFPAEAQELCEELLASGARSAAIELLTAALALENGDTQKALACWRRARSAEAYLDEYPELYDFLRRNGEFEDGDGEEQTP